MFSNLRLSFDVPNLWITRMPLQKFLRNRSDTTFIASDQMFVNEMLGQFLPFSAFELTKMTIIHWPLVANFSMNLVIFGCKILATKLAIDAFNHRTFGMLTENMFLNLDPFALLKWTKLAFLDQDFHMMNIDVNVKVFLFVKDLVAICAIPLALC